MERCPGRSSDHKRILMLLRLSQLTHLAATSVSRLCAMHVTVFIVKFRKCSQLHFGGGLNPITHPLNAVLPRKGASKPMQVNSAFHPSGVGKCRPNAGMSGCSRLIQLVATFKPDSSRTPSGRKHNKNNVAYV